MFDAEVAKMLWEGFKVIVIPLLGILWLMVRNEMKASERSIKKVNEKLNDHDIRLAKLETTMIIELKNINDKLDRLLDKQ